MDAEFEAAAQDGQALPFALGCLAGALRQMPADDEGRFTIASHVLALGLILPLTVLMTASVISGDGALLTDGNRSAVPSLAALLLLLGAANVRIAWALLDRDWPRVAATGRMMAAISLTLAIVSGLVFVSAAGLVQAGIATLELVALLVLARWHGRLTPEAA